MSQQPQDFFQNVNSASTNNPGGMSSFFGNINLQGIDPLKLMQATAAALQNSSTSTSSSTPTNQTPLSHSSSPSPSPQVYGTMPVQQQGYSFSSPTLQTSQVYSAPGIQMQHTPQAIQNLILSQQQQQQQQLPGTLNSNALQTQFFQQQAQQQQQQQHQQQQSNAIALLQQALSRLPPHLSQNPAVIRTLLQGSSPDVSALLNQANAQTPNAQNGVSQTRGRPQPTPQLQRPPSVRTPPNTVPTQAGTVINSRIISPQNPNGNMAFQQNVIAQRHGVFDQSASPPPQNMPSTTPPPTENGSSAVLNALSSQQRQEREKLRVIHPDYKTPFQSSADMYERLVAYKLYTATEDKQAEIEKWAYKVDMATSRYQKQFETYEDKLRKKLEQVETDPLSEEEHIFINKLLYNDEFALWQQERPNISFQPAPLTTTENGVASADNTQSTSMMLPDAEDIKQEENVDQFLNF